MSETEKAIENLNVAKLILCNQQMLTSEVCIRIGQAITDAIALLKEQEAVVRCKDCKQSGIDSTSYPQYWCSAHSEYHDAEWFCADGERGNTDA